MQFSKMKLLTGLVSISMAAAMAGVPAQASETKAENSNQENTLEDQIQEVQAGAAAADYSDLTALSSDVQIPENFETQSESQLSNQQSVLFGQADDTNDELLKANSSLAENAVSSISDTASESALSEMRNESFNNAVSDNNLGVEFNQSELVVATPTEYLNIHSDASLSSDVVGKLYSNNVAKVLSDDGGDWVKIESGGVVGYVLSEYFVRGDEAKMLTDIISTDVAMLDSEAIEESEIQIKRSKSDRSYTVATLSKGEQVIVEDNDSEDGWIKVSTESGVTGYVKSEEVSVEDQYPSAESTDDYEERLADATTKDLVDDATQKAEEAQAVADAVAQKAEEAQSVVEDESEEATASQVKAAEIAKSLAETTAQSAENSQKVVEVVKESLQTSGTKTGQAVADFALQFVGNPYVWGGSSLTNGADCSGFTMAVYANFGISLPHYDASQRGYGIAIDSLADAMPGDLVCYYGHVGIYIGDGMIVHAANARDGIKVSRADYRTIATIRRIFY